MRFSCTTRSPKADTCARVSRSNSYRNRPNQLAVVVDDADQHITDVVRGEDLADNTPRQIALQRALGLPTPRYLHTPLVLGADGKKLSKQNGAAALDTSQPQVALNAAARTLGLTSQDGTLAQALSAWTSQWDERFGMTHPARSVRPATGPQAPAR